MVQLNLVPIIQSAFPIDKLDLYIGWGMYKVWVLLIIIAILNILFSGRNICNANIKMKENLSKEEFKFYLTNYINKVKINELKEE